MKDHPSLQEEADRRGVAVPELRREARPVREILARSSARPGARPRALSLQERRPPTSKQTPVARPRETEAELAEAFRSMGHSEASALVAARGRGARPNATGLVEAGRNLGLPPAQANTFARGRGGIREAVTKTEPASGDFKGGDFGKADYAFTPSDEPADWALLLTLSPGGTPDPDLVRGAVAAIDAENPVDNPVPEEALPAVKATLAAAWTKAGLTVDEMPAVLTAESLRDAFRRLRMSDRAAAVAAEGRGRRR